LVRPVRGLFGETSGCCWAGVPKFVHLWELHVPLRGGVVQYYEVAP